MSSYPLVFWLLVHVLFFSSTPENVSSMKLASGHLFSQKLDQCFFELRGKVDECCCDVETVNSLNKYHILPVIFQLVNKSFFRFFSVNLHRPCPFWPDDGMCVLKDCRVEEFSEEELPPYLKGSQPDFDPDIECSSYMELSLSKVNNIISPAQREDFNNWNNFDSSEDNFCEVDDESTSGQGDLSYVDLNLNPERYTGYAGHSPRRLWGAIYNENCFRPAQVPGNLYLPSLPSFHPSLLQEMCLEKRAFYRIISGLHASINIHLSAKYLLSGREELKFGPNITEFVHRFDSATTKGQGPVWLKNLYFAYLLVLRAIVKAEPYWKYYQFYTGNEEEDQLTRDQVVALVQAPKNFSDLFDESMMFTDNSSRSLKNEFKSHFKNISRIMDCVGCDKCKLWGILQVQGIGTALKILFSGHKIRLHSLHLSRTEVVALFNVLERFSSSIQSLETFRDHIVK